MRSLMWLGGAASLLALAGWACSPQVACGAGTRHVGNECLLVDAGVAADAGPTPDAGRPDASTGCTPACGIGFTCSGGSCVAVDVPAAWNCSPQGYADGTTCDCGCGAPDPDCADGGLPVVGCPGASPQCNPDGTCAACVPECSGRKCGSDGCGGDCGICANPSLPDCIAGQCVACTPNCTGAQCGTNGCGGSCGNCASGLACENGSFVSPPSGASCLGICGGIASSGCSCKAGCAAQGSCCANVSVCGCIPDCTGALCGDDGCGGVCGSCDPGQMCANRSCVTDPCAAAPCNGHGSCVEPAGSCVCGKGFAPPNCNACATGYAGYPQCVTDLCAQGAITCVDGGSCDPLTGLCVAGAADGGAPDGG